MLNVLFCSLLQAVAGIVGRADLIACIFYILTILTYIRHVTWREKCDLRHWLALSGAFLCASIAVLCKETAVSALVVCAIYDILKGYNTFSKDKVSSAHFSLSLDTKNEKVIQDDSYFELRFTLNVSSSALKFCVSTKRNSNVGTCVTQSTLRVWIILLEQWWCYKTMLLSEIKRIQSKRLESKGRRELFNFYFIFNIGNHWRTFFSILLITLKFLFFSHETVF